MDMTEINRRVLEQFRAGGEIEGMHRETVRDQDRLSLRADCARCFGLCCVAPAFSASADFAIDKAAGQPCPHLRPDFGCGIHDGLRQRGFPGCAVYDCFGAGQKVAQVTFGGRDWRQAPQTARQMFDVFAIMRQLHELLWYLTEALALRPARPLHGELRRALEETERLTRGRPDAILGLGVAGHRQHVNALLLRASELARASLCRPAADRSEADDRAADDADDRAADHGGAGHGGAGHGGAGHRAADHRAADHGGAERRRADHKGADHRGADLTGADLQGADLSGASLRGARLIAADLRRADLTGADLTGADLRGADLRDADLTSSIFLTQAQLDAAGGDAGTKLPPSLTRPAHWPAAGRDAG